MRKEKLRWFGHVKYRHTEAPVRQVEHIGLEDRKKRRDRPKLTWERVIQHDLEWRKKIHIANSNKFLG